MNGLRRLAEWQESVNDRSHRAAVRWGYKARKRYPAWVRVPCVLSILGVIAFAFAAAVASNVGNGGWVAAALPLIVAIGLAAPRYRRMKQISAEEKASQAREETHGSR